MLILHFIFNLTFFFFSDLCDFQYLPIGVSPKEPGVNTNIYNLIYPVGIPPYRWLKNDVPYFLPPSTFSRIDSVQQYVPKEEVDSLPGNVIGKTRKRRAGVTSYISFDALEIPTQSPADIQTAMKVKFLHNSHLERLQGIFDERPIWSKNALMYITKFTSEQLKVLLPAVAYYFTTGPWRIMWIRLGYDPRKDPSSRVYQTLDYRIRAMCEFEIYLLMVMYVHVYKQ